MVPLLASSVAADELPLRVVGIIDGAVSEAAVSYVLRGTWMLYLIFISRSLASAAAPAGSSSAEIGGGSRPSINGAAAGGGGGGA